MAGCEYSHEHDRCRSVQQADRPACCNSTWKCDSRRVLLSWFQSINSSRTYQVSDASWRCKPLCPAVHSQHHHLLSHARCCMLGSISSIVPMGTLMPMGNLVPMGMKGKPNACLAAHKGTDLLPAAAHLEPLHCGILCRLPPLSDVFPQVAHLFNNRVIAQHLGSLHEAAEEGVCPKLHTTPQALQPELNAALEETQVSAQSTAHFSVFSCFGVSFRAFPSNVSKLNADGTCCNGLTQDTINICAGGKEPQGCVVIQASVRD